MYCGQGALGAPQEEGRLGPADALGEARDAGGVQEHVDAGDQDDDQGHQHGEHVQAVADEVVGGLRGPVLQAAQERVRPLLDVHVDAVPVEEALERVGLALGLVRVGGQVALDLLHLRAHRRDDQEDRDRDGGGEAQEDHQHREAAGDPQAAEHPHQRVQQHRDDHRDDEDQQHAAHRLGEDPDDHDDGRERHELRQRGLEGGAPAHPGHPSAVPLRDRHALAGSPGSGYSPARCLRSPERSSRAVARGAVASSAAIPARSSWRRSPSSSSPCSPSSSASAARTWPLRPVRWPRPCPRRTSAPGPARPSVVIARAEGVEVHIPVDPQRVTAIAFHADRRPLGRRDGGVGGAAHPAVRPRRPRGPRHGGPRRGRAGRHDRVRAGGRRRSPA